MSSSFKLQSHRANNTKVIYVKVFNTLKQCRQRYLRERKIATFVIVFEMVFQMWVKGILLLSSQNCNFRHLFCFGFSLSLFLSTSLFLYFLLSLHLSAVWKYS